MRYEIKIPITDDNLLIFYNWRDNLRNLKKIYQDRIVNSIYYDEKNLTFANDNIIGISERIKTRLRWYNDDSNFFYEFKFKRNKIGEKIIIPSNKSLNEISLSNLFNHNNNEFKLNKFENKINYIVTKHDLFPILKVTYNRSYYLFMNKIRLTFDTPAFFQIFSQNSFKIKNKDFLFILELKFHPNDYLIAQKLISDSQFIPKRFSKYVRGLAINNLINYI